MQARDPRLVQFALKLFFRCCRRNGLDYRRAGDDWREKHPQISSGEPRLDEEEQSPSGALKTRGRGLGRAANLVVTCSCGSVDEVSTIIIEV